ncbi:c2h2 finger domain containing protein [Grosmannia clavigera kw1407]|uniref:C2h2 finger domain containing protein n=1 Tax=Grosmannia clavigera (strain kw1407 / UAMH 11150) TaxID=655863 RepID=F0XTB8_GROCL|nr:c2h2 finger domain containing protein [Grosmannia clavigera kw1407]EFW99380.1 c2h2 finger domain containing protein [Grosmannia clavigera kw1407]
MKPPTTMEIGFSGARLSSSSIQANQTGSGSSSSHKLYPDGSIFFSQGQQQQESWPEPEQQPPHTISYRSQAQRSESSATASYSSYRTGATGGTQTSASTSPSAYSPFTNPADAESTDTCDTSLNRQQALEQMSVSLNPPVSFGGHTSLVYDHLAHSHTQPQSHSPSSQGGQLLRPLSQQWSSAGSVNPNSGQYSHHTTPSPTAHDSHFTHRDPPGFQSTMSEGHGNGDHGGNLGGYGDMSSQQHHPQHQQQYQQRHQHQQQQQQHQHGQHSQHHQQIHGLPVTSLHSSLLPPTHGQSSLGALLRQGSGSSSADSEVMAYREQPSVHTTAESAYLPKLNQVAPLSSQQQYHDYSNTDYHRRQQGTANDPSMRLVPPHMAAQAGLPDMAHPMSYSAGPGPDRTYPYHQSPSSSISGPVMSNISNPGGHMSIIPGVGMPFGGGHKPLLYSNGHHTIPHHLGGNLLGHHLGLGKGSQSHERPFRCDQCPQSFNRNHDLKRHKRIHLAVKPFPCNYCDKSFSRKDALKRHRLVKGCGDKLQNAEGESSAGSIAHSDGGGSSIMNNDSSDMASDDHQR